MDEREAILATVRLDPLAGIDPQAGDDWHRWRALLRVAWPFGPLDPVGVYGALRCLRALGCRLTVGRDAVGEAVLQLWPWEGGTVVDLGEVLGDHAPLVRRLLRDAADRGRTGDVKQWPLQEGLEPDARKVPA